MVVTPKEVLYTMVDQSFPGEGVNDLMHACAYVTVMYSVM